MTTFTPVTVQFTGHDFHNVRDYYTRSNLGDALVRDGCVAVSSKHLIEVMDCLYEVAKEYFSQSEETKADDITGDNFITGYVPTRSRNNKQTIFCRLNGEGLPKHVGMKSLMETTARAVKEDADVILHYLCQYLRMPPGEIDTTLSGLRVAYYPPETNAGTMAHRDFNTITLLPPATATGLQIYHENQWKTVEHPKDHTLVICGKQMTRLTAGYMKAVEHRVINLNPQSREARISSIFFASFKQQYSLAPLYHFSARMTAEMSPDEKKEYLAQFTDITVGDLFWHQLSNTLPLSEEQKKRDKELVEQGLFPTPSDALVAKYPEVFK